jgi:hypothetical protein
MIIYDDSAEAVRAVLVRPLGASLTGCGFRYQRDACYIIGYGHGPVTIAVLP